MSIHLYLAPAAAGKTAFAVARAREAARGAVGSMAHWRSDARAAAILAGALRNDHV